MLNFGKGKILKIISLRLLPTRLPDTN